MHQFLLIREYKREVPQLDSVSGYRSTKSVEIDRSKGSYEKAIETQTDERNEKTHDKQRKKADLKDSQSRRPVEY